MIPCPLFKVQDLHIWPLRILQNMNFPQDELGWENGFPPVSVRGGANGHGQSALLRCITKGVLFKRADLGTSTWPSRGSVR